ncbi:MAG: hypothetical protein Q8N05_20710, partial [Bacteroidota bacterium]|nr:hypothetical protein [Bacteroidota bacterium]
LLTTNEPKPVRKIEKGGQHDPDLFPTGKVQRGGKMLRICSKPTRQHRKGGQYAPDFFPLFSIPGVSASAGLSCKTRTKIRKNTVKSPGY